MRLKRAGASGVIVSVRPKAGISMSSPTEPLTSSLSSSPGRTTTTFGASLPTSIRALITRGSGSAGAAAASLPLPASPSGGAAFSGRSLFSSGGGTSAQESVERPRRTTMTLSRRRAAIGE